MMPMMLSLVAGRDGWRIRAVKPGWYHITREGQRFPLAGGDMAHAMKIWERLRAAG